MFGSVELVREGEATLAAPQDWTDPGDDLTTPATAVDLREVLKRGHEEQDKAEVIRRADDKGLLRAGSAGCVTSFGTIGECHRLAHLRLVDVEKPVPPDRRLMFSAGQGNEDLWEQVCVPGWTGKVLRSQEVRRRFPWGTIKGSPDVVLARQDGSWDTVLELKLVSALNSAIYRELEGKPDGKHLVQAATYMWLCGVPVVLCYTSRTDFALQFQAKKYGKTKLTPFYRLFYLSFDKGRLYYRDEQDLGAPKPTLVTVAGIRKFYEDVVTGEPLGARPSTVDALGEDYKYNRCDPKYCWAAPACDQWERSYPEWRAEAQRLAESKVF